MILYLHGFRSSPTSRKATMLRERMRALGRESEYFCPQLPASPRAAIDLALRLVRTTQYPMREKRIANTSRSFQ